ncbi:hypothetical protein [Nonomuraea solani]|nr:hypothetical protein [Nonomuraea solani]
MSFDLAVLAMGGSADHRQACARYERCRSAAHDEADLDPGILAFCHELREWFPDSSPLADDTPWAIAPLRVGADHVIMRLRYGTAGDLAVERIGDLAWHHGLVLFDPQFGEAFFPAPDGWEGPMDCGGATVCARPA